MVSIGHSSASELPHAIEIGFSSKEFLELDPAARIEKCRQLAVEAERLAAACIPEMRKSYRELAEGWRTLAKELARGE